MCFDVFMIGCEYIGLSDCKMNKVTSKDFENKIILFNKNVVIKTSF